MQDYAGYEVGKPEMARVVVYRPAEEVFNRDSMRSYAGAPVTIDHPGEAVTPTNWKDHAVGEVASDDIVKDGEAIRVPFLLRDGSAIETVLAGKRQISMGYECTLDWTPGTTADGVAYDAVQRGIRINHLAIVDRARGGPTLRIGDQKEPSMKIKIGDAEVEVTDGAAVAVAVGTLNQKMTDAAAKASAAETALADAKTALSTSEGKVLALETQLADAKAQLDPAKLDQRVADRAKLIADAKKIMPTVVTDAVSDADVRRAVVVGRLGEAAAGLDDSGIAGAFITMLSCEDAAGTKVQPMGSPQVVKDAAAREQQAFDKANDFNGWRTQAAA